VLHGVLVVKQSGDIIVYLWDAGVCAKEDLLVLDAIFGGVTSFG
jgi:hypothetical protein